MLWFSYIPIYLYNPRIPDVGYIGIYSWMSGLASKVKKIRTGPYFGGYGPWLQCLPSPSVASTCPPRVHIVESSFSPGQIFYMSTWSPSYPANQTALLWEVSLPSHNLHIPLSSTSLSPENNTACFARLNQSFILLRSLWMNEWMNE